MGPVLSSASIPAGGVFNNSIFIVGGPYDGYWIVQYDLIESKLIEITSLSDHYITTQSQSYSQFGDKLYIIQSESDSILIFDLQTKSFQSYNHIIPTSIYYGGCLTATANFLFIVGGVHKNHNYDALNMVQIFDFSQNQFIPNSIHMKETRYDLSCAYHKGTSKLYAIAGMTSNGIGFDSWSHSVEVISTIDIENQSWSYVNDNLGIVENLGDKNHQIRSAVWGNSIFLIGFDAATIDVLSDSVIPMSDQLVEKQSNALVVISDNVVYVLGGRTDGYFINYLQYYELTPAADTSSTLYPTLNPTDQSNVIINTHPSMQPASIQWTSIQPTSIQSTSIQSTSIQPTSIQPTSIQPTLHDNIISIFVTEYHKQASITDTKGQHMDLLHVVFIVAAVFVLIFLMIILCVIFKSKSRKMSNHSTLLMTSNKKKPPIKILMDDNINDRLLTELDKYRETMAGSGDIADINITQVLDDYHRLLQAKMVINVLEPCDVESCDIFRRNYRNKSDFENKHDIERLYMSNDKVNNNLNDKLNDNDRIAICQILDKIHSFCYHASDVFDTENKETDIIKNVQNKMSKKYNQLYRNSVVRQDIFIFGWPFIYGDDVNENKDNDVTILKPKYSTLRQELTCNDINKISMEQFMNEYLKAEIHFSCAFKKEKYSAMSIEHILALMVYCNYDELQYEFSKTYRETNNKHENYYHLGKLLKQSVLYYGTRIKDGMNKEFYHGITQKLIPSEIVGHLGKGISIYCPLSTSTSIYVAKNFTSNNAGLVITFGGEASKARYYPVSWLSDFGSENEHLFLQNKEELQIENILDCSTSNQYRNILNALKTMDAIMWESHYFKDEKSAKTMAPMIKLIVKMIHHQLSVTLNDLEWERFDDLPDYGQQLLDVYFRNKTKLAINYSVLEQKYPDLFCLFCVNEFDWVNIKILNAIFSNIKEIEITNINSCANVMEDISTNRSIFCQGKGSWNLDKMTIKSNKSSDLRAPDAVAKYKQILKENITKITIRSVDWENNDYDTLVLE